MSTDPNPRGATADYVTHDAWYVGPDDLPDHEQIIVMARTAHLLDGNGAERLPSVRFRLPEVAGQAAGDTEMPASYAEAFGRYLIHAAHTARKATS